MSSLYVHIPFCKRRCKYCTFVSGCDYSKASIYFECLKKEAQLRKSGFPEVRSLDTVFIGGGTPSSVGSARLQQLFVIITDSWKLNDNYEFTVECNPESVDEQLVDVLCVNGVNRVSLGLQSSNNQTLATIGRLHTVKQFDNAVNLLQSKGINNINADIILGLPESQDSFLESIAHVVKLGVKHVSVYALEVYKNSVMYKECKKGLYSLPTDTDYLCDLYDMAVRLLQDNGYMRYEVSNFSKEGYQCRHNLNYWLGGNYLGLGCSAHWYMRNRRFRNNVSLDKYIANILQNKPVARCYERLEKSDLMLERIMLGLRLSEGVDIDKFYKDFGIDIYKAYPKIKFMTDNNFMYVKCGRLKVVPDKLYVLNSILSEIL